MGKMDFILETEAKSIHDQRAVFEILIKNNANFAPFKESTMEEYKKILGRPIKHSSIQTALESLRQKELIWKNSFGGYVLENENYTTLFGVNGNDKQSPGEKEREL